MYKEPRIANAKMYVLAILAMCTILHLDTCGGCDAF